MTRATEIVSYEECRKYAQSNGVRSQRDWNFHLLIRKYAKTLASDIPLAPEAYYKRRGTWKNWGDFLGTNNQKNKTYMKFQDAKNFLKLLGIKSSNEFYDYCKNKQFLKPVILPSTPRTAYKSEWNGWSDFLGNAKTRKGRHMSFEKAREFIRKLKLKNRQEFYDLKKRGLIPITIPRSPDKVYG